METCGRRRQRGQLDGRKRRQRHRRHQTGGERVGLGARKLSERRRHGRRIGRWGDPIREAPRLRARGLRPRREGAPARVQVGEEAPQRVQKRTERGAGRRFLLGSQARQAHGERSLALAAGARRIAPRRREPRRGVVELATEIGGRAVERGACLERAVPRRFEPGYRLVQGRDLDLVRDLLHEVANDVELDHLDGVGVEDELARLAGGERRRGARGHDQRRARLLGAHEGARRAALGDQGHAHGPIVT